MIHDPQIAVIIVADMPEIVAEAGAAAEMLLVQAEAAIERVAPDIDDESAGQDLVDKADMLEIE